jgi:hypothetical protein
MGALEIVLLIFGVVVFILSFVIPVKKDKISKEDKILGEELVRKMVDDQLVVVSSQIEHILDEKNEDHMERIERRMERLSNEKIMAVGEYSDTVLSNIKKSHDEVVFLYDMLNSKHKSLNELVEKIDRKSIKQVKEFEKQTEVIQYEEKVVVEEFLPLKPRVVEVRRSKEQEKRNSKNKVAIQFSKNATMGQNSNKRILQLHNEGKSNMVIAKELGLGIGEVKLVIDLFKGM